MAPLEEKTISSSITSSRDISFSTSESLILGTDTETSDDLSTMVERELIKEHKKTRSSSSSAKVGGSYGGFSGSASTNRSSSSSFRNFAKNLSKNASRAVKKTNTRKSKTTNSERSENFSNSSEFSNSSTIRNENPGRTLNILALRISNRYEETAYVEAVSYTHLTLPTICSV